MDTKFFNRQEMEERLPDYIFGRLPEDETKKFELSLVEYPDLVQEIEDVRNVFIKLERSNIDAFLDRKTKNIPYKVSQRLQQKKNPLNIFAKPAFTTIVAGFAIILIAISIYFTNKKNYQHKQIEQYNFTSEITNPTFSQLDQIVELAQTDSLDIFQTSELVTPMLFESTSIYEPFSDFLDSIVMDRLVDLLDHRTKVTLSLYYITFYNHLDKLDENDFQQIIEELKNVNI